MVTTSDKIMAHEQKTQKNNFGLDTSLLPS